MIEPRLVSLDEFKLIERELMRPTPKRKGINHQASQRALAGSTTLSSWVFRQTQSKSGKAVEKKRAKLAALKKGTDG